MKASSLIFLSIMMIAITSSCKKKSGSEINPVPADNYASIGAFHSTNGAQLQLFTVDGAGGGQFTAPKGTRVTVPANAFLTQAGGNVTGAVTIQFKEIYLKNDMLLSDMSLNAFWGPPIKSGGMFFLKAIQNNEALKLNTGKKLTIEQPLQGLSADTGMMAMVLMQRQDSTKQPGWVNADLDSLRITITGYIFGLYNFMSPADSGTWSNSDNPNFFTGPYTLLNLHPLDSVSVYHTEIFLVFKNVNSMVHVYYQAPDFPYNYAPLGYQCYAVAVGLKAGKLYSSFTPITITTNLTVSFSLALTTTDDFKAQLSALP